MVYWPKRVEKKEEDRRLTVRSRTMNKGLMAGLLGLSFIACPILYFAAGPQLSQLQWETLRLLLMVAGGSWLYCFVVGELARNNSQMDKLWSLLPPVYLWIMAAKGGMEPRLIVMAVLATLWGGRLTFNFARKGAYTLKFWAGREDYRWQVLREQKAFQPHWKWLLFNLFFISLYQNALVLAITLPGLICVGANAPLGWMDLAAALLTLAFLVLETVADAQQWRFYTGRAALQAKGLALADMPEPYCKGFNTTGLWRHSRHPNYLGEQGIWVCMYLFSIAAGVGVFNWSLIGALLLIVLFMGSSAFGEEISASKYPAYADYQRHTSRFIPFKR